MPGHPPSKPAPQSAASGQGKKVLIIGLIVAVLGTAAVFASGAHRIRTAANGQTAIVRGFSCLSHPRPRPFCCARCPIVGDWRWDDHPRPLCRAPLPRPSACGTVVGWFYNRGVGGVLWGGGGMNGGFPLGGFPHQTKRGAGACRMLLEEGCRSFVCRRAPGPLHEPGPEIKPNANGHDDPC